MNTREGIEVGLSLKSVLQPKEATEVRGWHHISENVVVIEGFVDVIERRIHGEHSDRKTGSD